MSKQIDICDVLADTTPCVEYDQKYWDFFYECMKKAANIKDEQ